MRGILYGDAGQLWAQLLDAAVVCVFGFVMAYVWFKFSNLITPIRVSKEVELEGLDGPEMGCLGLSRFRDQGRRAGRMNGGVAPGKASVRPSAWAVEPRYPRHRMSNRWID